MRWKSKEHLEEALRGRGYEHLFKYGVDVYVETTDTKNYTFLEYSRDYILSRYPFLTLNEFYSAFAEDIFNDQLTWLHEQQIKTIDMTHLNAIKPKKEITL